MTVNAILCRPKFNDYTKEILENHKDIWFFTISMFFGFEEIGNQHRQMENPYRPLSKKLRINGKRQHR